MRVYHDFFWYPDPVQRFLMRIRILIRPNDTDPTGSGSETLMKPIVYDTLANAISRQFAGTTASVQYTSWQGCLILDL